jgi:hypothetical protein
MRWLFVIASFAACAPSDLQQRAQTTLGSGRLDTHLQDHDVIGGLDVWTFCRDESRRKPFNRSYDGMCVVLTCPPNAPASSCGIAPR